MRRPLTSLAALVTASAITLSAVVPPREAIAQTEPSSKVPVSSLPSPSECRQLKDENIRAATQSITEKRLTAELSGLNYAALVQEYWQETNVERKIDEQIDTAIKEVRADTNWLGRAYSTVSKEKAEELAVTVANKTYDSTAFRNAMSDLTTAMGTQIGARLEKAAAEASGPAVSCMRLALEARYGSAISQAFVRQTEQTLNLAAQSGTPSVSWGDLAFEGREAIGGILLVMSRRLIARMVTQMGRRLAGAIATRIVSSFTGLIGLALIVKDVIDAGKGVFPLIEERMKSSESKKLIKTEIAESISSYVNENVERISNETAENMFAMWQAFQKRYDLLLSLADTKEQFAEFLRNRSRDEVSRLGELVELIVQQEGEIAVFRRLDNGSLKTSMEQLTSAGVEIARETRSLDGAIAWSKLAGKQTDDVLKFGVHRRIRPEQISRVELDRLLSVDDKTAVYRLAALPRAALSKLLALPTSQIRSLARRLARDELLALSRYQTDLSDASSRTLLESIARDPEQMEKLAQPHLQDSVLSSVDEEAAIDMLVNRGQNFSLFRMINDFEKVTSSRVQPRVFIEAYPWTLFAVLAIMMIFVLLIWRVLRGGRRKPSAKN